MGTRCYLFKLRYKDDWERVKRILSNPKNEPFVRESTFYKVTKNVSIFTPEDFVYIVDCGQNLQDRSGAELVLLEDVPTTKHKITDELHIKSIEKHCKKYGFDPDMYLYYYQPKDMLKLERNPFEVLPEER